MRSPGWSRTSAATLGTQVRGLSAFCGRTPGDTKGLHGLRGSKHNRRVVHPARPAGAVSEAAGQAGAEW